MRNDIVSLCTSLLKIHTCFAPCQIVSLIYGLLVSVAGICQYKLIDEIFMRSCTTLQKLQPVRIQENHFTFDGITSNLPIVHHPYIPLAVLASVTSMARCRIVMERSYGVSRLPLVFLWHTFSR